MPQAAPLRLLAAPNTSRLLLAFVTLWLAAVPTHATADAVLVAANASTPPCTPVMVSGGSYSLPALRPHHWHQAHIRFPAGSWTECMGSNEAQQLLDRLKVTVVGAQC